MTAQLHCERCGRFIGEDCLEGWTGGFFGDYNGRYYCAPERGCMVTPEPATAGDSKNPFGERAAA